MRSRQDICAIQQSAQTAISLTTLLTLAGTSRAQSCWCFSSQWWRWEGGDGTLLAPLLSNAPAQSRPSQHQTDHRAVWCPEIGGCWQTVSSWPSSWLSITHHSYSLSARRRSLQRWEGSTRSAPVRKLRTSRNYYKYKETQTPDRMLSSVTK